MKLEFRDHAVILGMEIIFSLMQVTVGILYGMINN